MSSCMGTWCNVKFRLGCHILCDINSKVDIFQFVIFIKSEILLVRIWREIVILFPWLLHRGGSDCHGGGLAIVHSQACCWSRPSVLLWGRFTNKVSRVEGYPVIHFNVFLYTVCILHHNLYVCMFIQACLIHLCLYNYVLVFPALKPKIFTAEIWCGETQTSSFWLTSLSF